MVRGDEREKGVTVKKKSNEKKQGEEEKQKEEENTTKNNIGEIIKRGEGGDG